MDESTDNHSITPDVRPRIEELDRFAARPDVRRAIARADGEARDALRTRTDRATAFAGVDLSGVGCPVPASVGSVRVFVTRGIGGPACERHANSTQYLLALDGAIETHVETADGWRVDRYGRGDPTVLENRWHVLQPEVWHRSAALEDRVWSVVAFHSARDVVDETR